MSFCFYIYKGCRPSFCHELNFLKICKGFIRDIYVTERKRVKLPNNFTIFFSSYNIIIALRPGSHLRHNDITEKVTQTKNYSMLIVLCR